MEPADSRPGKVLGTPLAQSPRARADLTRRFCAWRSARGPLPREPAALSRPGPQVFRRGACWRPPFPRICGSGASSVQVLRRGGPQWHPAARTRTSHGVHPQVLGEVGLWGAADGKTCGSRSGKGAGSRLMWSLGPSGCDNLQLRHPQSRRFSSLGSPVGLSAEIPRAPAKQSRRFSAGEGPGTVQPRNPAESGDVHPQVLGGGPPEPCGPENLQLRRSPRTAPTPPSPPASAQLVHCGTGKRKGRRRNLA